jgi:hypothetical protein
MLVLKRSIQLFIIAAMAVSGIASAGEHYHPFAESLDFNPDWQFFAPVDLEQLEELHPRKRANKGWYVTYDRMHIGLTRPNINGAQPSQIDMTWGNRWDLGFMGEKNTGWLFSWTSVSGPNVYFDRRDQRFIQPAAGVERFPGLRPRFPFDSDFGDGTILVRQSLNVATLTNLEFNKTWRLSPYHYGGILEPMIGLRYLGFNDYARNEDHEYFIIGTGTTYNAESFQIQTTRTDNRMITGQLGYRYVQPVKRMTFSHDGRFFAGPNFQTQGYSNYLFALTSAGAIAGFGDPYQQLSTYAGKDNTEFVIGTDLRFEAAYQFTKAFNIRMGAQVLYVGRGIWRGSNPGLGPQNENDQNIVSPAWTFGATFNR